MRPALNHLATLLALDSDTGLLMWRERPGQRAWNTRYAGKPALQSVNRGGYRYGSISGHSYQHHTVVFALANGRWPEGCVDHVDGDRLNNRPANLRETDASGNARNAAKRRDNTSGATGVSWSEAKGAWQAYICVDKAHQHLGFFSDKSDAIEARRAASTRAGFHPNHGRG